MSDYLSISLNTSLKDFLRRVWMENEPTTTEQRKILFELFSILKQVGCDYYELINLYAEHVLSESELCTLANLSPSPIAILPVTLQNIRESISHWTPSKYHTAPIAEVVHTIEHLLTCSKIGLTIFNSNLNPKNKHSANDTYILLITHDSSFFLDINRKATTKFQKE